MYFTDKESIAENYAEAGNALTKWNFNALEISDLAKDEIEKALVKRGDDIYKAKVYLKALEQSSEARLLYEYDGDIPKDKQKQLNAIHEAFVNIDKLEQMPTSRNLYTVKIHGDKTLEELNFLRWDKEPTKEQLESIKSIYDYFSNIADYKEASLLSRKFDMGVIVIIHILASILFNVALNHIKREPFFVFPCPVPFFVS